MHAHTCVYLCFGLMGGWRGKGVAVVVKCGLLKWPFLWLDVKTAAFRYNVMYMCVCVQAMY
jgi:hypothetical protein